MNLPPNSTPLSPFVLGFIASLFWLTAAIAQDLPIPQNSTEILKELDKIDQRSKSNENNRRSAAISQIQAAANSAPAAVDLYLRALENTKYLESHQDYVDWSRKNQELLHSISFQSAAQLQMRYLAMALQRDEKHDAFTQIPECLSYLETLASQKSLRPAAPDANDDDDSGAKTSQSPSQQRIQKKIVKTTSTDKPYKEALNLIKQPVDKSAVVEWLQISDLIPDTNFEASAGNYQSIMDKNVRGPLRAKNDPRIFQTWDTQITMETAIATQSDSKQQADAFNQSRLPYLLFHKAQDTATIGQPNRALGEVIVLVRNYPSNPSLQEWTAAARTLLTNPTITPIVAVPQTNGVNGVIPLAPPPTAALGIPIVPTTAH